VLGGLIRTILILIIAGIAAAIGAIIMIGALVFTGSPAACVDRAVPVSAAASQELRAAWRAFGAQAAQGPASISITETQATSRGVEYVEEKDAPVEELQVYFCPGGYAEASGRISVLGAKTKVVVRGTLDLSGSSPRIQIDSVRAGNLPSFIAKPAVDLVLNTGDLRTLDLDEHLTGIQFSDGIAHVQGGP
jgi:hypothetical protein